MTAGQIVSVFNATRAGKGKWSAKCPSHKDRSPSLSLREGKDAMLIRCWAGCTIESVLDAVGLQMRDLWYAREGKQDAATIKAIRQKRLKDEQKSYRDNRQRRHQNRQEHLWACVCGALHWMAEKHPENPRIEELFWENIGKTGDKPIAMPIEKNSIWARRPMREWVTTKDVGDEIARVLGL
ncbi:MAG TPA: hypothetical protein VGK96_28355 [Candidatus Sulfotelmatobacter sp.]|jgi:hypothetical protein